MTKSMKVEYEVRNYKYEVRGAKYEMPKEGLSPFVNVMHEVH